MSSPALARYVTQGLLSRETTIRLSLAVMFDGRKVWESYRAEQLFQNVR